MSVPLASALVLVAGYQGEVPESSNGWVIRKINKGKVLSSSPGLRLQVNNIGKLETRYNVARRIFVAAEFALGARNVPEEVAFGVGITPGIVGYVLQTRKHPRAGGFPAPLTTIAVEIHKGASIQNSQGQWGRVVVRGGYISIYVSVGISPLGVRLVEAEFYQELKEVCGLEPPADVRRLAGG